MQEYVLTPLSDLQNVADTIRETTGSTDTFSVSGLSDAVKTAIENGTGGGDGLDGLSIYTDPSTYGGTPMVSVTTINIPEGRTIQTGDLIVDGTGKVFLVTSVSEDLVYIASTGIDLKGAAGEQGNYILPIGVPVPTSVLIPLAVAQFFFHCPDGYTVRVGDMVIGTNGYLARVSAIDSQDVTVLGTGINILSSLTKETWTFELEDGSTVTKAVYVG